MEHGNNQREDGIGDRISLARSGTDPSDDAVSNELFELDLAA